MNSKKLAFLATTALIGNAFVGGTAAAQSTGTRAAELRDVVVVTGNAGPPAAGPAIAQEVDKTRSTIDQETIERQNPGQTILQSLNLVPGLNFTNADPYGNSGGNIRLRGFDGNRVGLAFDGVPLNDTGNYATFTNQQLDPELISSASVNQGTTDVDSPTAAAIGGIINYVSATPDDKMGVQINGSMGDFDYGRVFARFDTGEIGPWGTKAYATISNTKYNKFKGPGDLEKQQYNLKIYQPLSGSDFISVAAHYNRNRNAFYNNTATLAKNAAGQTVLDTRGPFPENDIACSLPAAGNGTAQNENTGSSFTRYNNTTGTGSCTNFFGLRINPSDTGNIRINSRFALTDYLTLTVDPSFQYVMANGGGFTGAISERDNRLDQNNANNTAACLAGANLNGGVDLNGDGDSCDTASIYTPSNTNTRRYGVLASLIWKVDDNNQLRLSYTNDYGRHRQTGESTDLPTNAVPFEVYGGKEGWGDTARRITGVDGSFFRTRDRFSLAILNQLSVDYFGSFLDDSLSVAIGARAPQFKRELNQYCYSQNGSTNVLCTTQAVATTLANGNVQFAGDTNQYIAPYKAEFTYDKILPNLSLGYTFLGDSKVYASYSEQIAVPRTDNLYIGNRLATATTLQPIAFNGVDPEMSKNYEIGYRFTTNDVVASASLYQNDYSNRVVSSLDNDPASPTFNTTIDRNVGKVKTRGFEGSVGWQATDTLSLYGSATYTDAKLQENQVRGLTTFLPTKGKNVVETPEWMYTARADWEMNDLLSFGLQAKYVGRRFTTDVNDEAVPAYTTVDFDARLDLTDFTGMRDSYLQFNVTNFTDEVYAVNISSGQNALLATLVDATGAAAGTQTGALRTFGIAAPRTAVLTLGAKF